MRGCLDIRNKIITRTIFPVLALVLGITTAVIPATEVAASPGPDLIIANVTLSPAEPALGDTVTITAAVKNQGTGVAGTSHVACHIDSDILTSEYIDSIDPGTTITKTFTWTAQAGAHSIMVTADSSGKVAETDETNNSATYNFSTLVPDLIISSITWEPEDPSRGDTVVFTIGVKNQGNATTKSTKLDFCIDGKSRGYQDIFPLPPGQTTTRTYSWIAQSGQHPLTATIDGGSLIPEGDETNNVTTVTFSTLAPDLTVDQITWTPVNPSKNDDVTFTVTVKNNGSGRADSCHIAYYIDDTYMSAVPVDAIEGGAAANVTLTWTVISQSHELKTVIDFYGKIAESDESNNENTAAFLTLSPDLSVKSITWTPSNAAVGDTVTFTVTLRNQGSGTAEPSRTACYIDGKLSQSILTEAIAADTEVEIPFQWEATSGNHIIKAYPDYQFLVKETNEENNWLSANIHIIPPELSISQITCSPDDALPGDTVTFIVSIVNNGGGVAEHFRVGYHIDDEYITSDYVERVESDSTVNVTYDWKLLNGIHVFTAIVDYNQLIAEMNEEDNVNTFTVVPNMPDLLVTNIDWSPADLPAGEEVTFSIKVKNQGSNTAAASRLAYYIDNELIGYHDIGEIAADGTVTDSILWAATEGGHIIKVVADSNDQVTEIYENNNVREASLPPPDLTIQDIAWTPPDAAIGETVAFTATIKNQGPGRSQKSVATCYIDGLLIDSQDVAEIRAGKTATAYFEWVSEGGIHELTIIADESDLVTEGNEMNNEKNMPVSIKTPDLAIADISWSITNSLLTDEVTFNVTITNPGSDTAAESRLTYYVDDVAVNSRDVDPIAAGNSITEVFEVSVDAETHTFRIVVDSSDEIEEIDETNNEDDAVFSTKSPDLVVKNITWLPLDALVGDNVTITVKVENRGRDTAVNPRLDLQIDGSSVGYVDLEEVEPGTFVTGDFTWTVVAGQHDIEAFVDIEEIVLEHNEDNNSKSRTIAFAAPAPANPQTAVPTTGSETGSLLDNLWWFIMLAALFLGGGAFYVAFKAIRQR